MFNTAKTVVSTHFEWLSNHRPGLGCTWHQRSHRLISSCRPQHDTPAHPWNGGPGLASLGKLEVVSIEQDEAEGHICGIYDEMKALWRAVCYLGQQRKQWRRCVCVMRRSPIVAKNPFPSASVCVSQKNVHILRYGLTHDIDGIMKETRESSSAALIRPC